MMPPVPPRLLAAGLLCAVLAGGALWVNHRAWHRGMAAAEATCAARFAEARARFDATLAAMEAARDAVPVPDPDTVLERLREGRFAVPAPAGP